MRLPGQLLGPDQTFATRPANGADGATFQSPVLPDELVAANGTGYWQYDCDGALTFTITRTIVVGGS